MSAALRRIVFASYGRWLAATLAVALGPVALANFAVDPLQYFRRATLYPPHFSAQQRHQAPGLARHYDYDTVVVGSSMAQIFYPADVAAALGGRALNLAIAGSLAREQRLALDVALGTGRVRRVLWGLDWFAFAAPPDRVRSDYGPFPDYLYRAGPGDHLRYVLNLGHFRSTLEIAAALAGWRGGDGFETDLERLNRPDLRLAFGRDEALRAFRNPKSRLAAQHVFALLRLDRETMRRSLEANFVAAVAAHPGVAFDAFLPPYSVLLPLFYRRHFPEAFAAMAAFRELAAAAASGRPNLRLHDVQADPEIITDLDAYSDMSHHSRAVARRILAAIAAGAAPGRPAAWEAEIQAWAERNPDP